MPGSSNLPYRPPCAGWPKIRRFLKGCWQHFRLSETHLQRWKNITTVPNFICPPDGPADVFPFSRQVDVLPASCFDDPVNANCSTTDYPPACDGSDSGKPPCNAWPDSFRNDCGNDSTHATVDGNCYQKVSEYSNPALCQKLGFKNVQAKKAWHGVWGFDSFMRNTIPFFDESGTSCAAGRGPENLSPDNTKYLTCTLHMEYSDSEGGSYTGDAVSSVGRYSGKGTATCSESGASRNATLINTFPDTIATIAGNLQGWGPNDLYQAFAHGVANIGSNVDALYITAAAHAVTYDYTIGGGTTHITGGVTLDPATNTYTLYEDRSGGETSHYLRTVVLTGTTAEWTEEYSESSDEGSFSQDLDILYTLSDPYTSAQLQADIITLLGHWDLTDDLVYPWRIDQFPTVAPLMSYDESTAAGPNCALPDPDDSHCLHFNDDYTGAVRGSPNPAGYDGHFDWRHQTYRECADMSGGGSSIYLFMYGAQSGAGAAGSGFTDFTDSVVPKSATQWTDNLTAQSWLPGAWMWSSGPNLLAQKWAEILVYRPSYNFARPCGSDRYLIEESTVRCATISDAGPPIVLGTADSATAIDTGDACLVCGVGSGADGLWTVTKLGDFVYELTTKLSDIPGIDATQCQTGIIAKLRFSGVPPICGRLQIASTSIASGTVTVHLSQPADYLQTGDVVDFIDASGSVTEANKTVTVVSSTQFTYSASVVPTGTYIKTHGAPDYWWYDSQVKGQYAIAQWTLNNRVYQERDAVIALSGYCGASAGGSAIRTHQADHGMPRAVSDFSVSQGCAEINPCNPVVLYSTPNDESFTNSPANIDWPNFDADAGYDALWQCAFVQHIADPFWELPHPPCVDDSLSLCSPTEDDGTCQADDCVDEVGGNLYYPQRPWLENILALPTNGGPAQNLTAPATPTSIHLGYLSLADLDTASPVSGNVLPPPVAPGDDGGCLPTPAFFTPWEIFQREQVCVCAGGRFALDYLTNAVPCR